MSRGQRKFSIMAEKTNEDLRRIVVNSLRKGFKEALDVAVDMTVHDSSNAAAHWMLGVQGRTRPDQRAMGRPENRDLRGRGHPLVGEKGNQGTHKTTTMKGVADREWTDVIYKYVRGNAPEMNLFLFNSIGSVGGYSENANIIAAGEAAAKHAIAVFDREMRNPDNLKRNRR